MKKIFLPLAITLSIVSFASANSHNENRGLGLEVKSIKASSTLSTTTLACAGNAIDKRETAIILAHDNMSSSTRAALVLRKDTLKTAWTIADKDARNTAKKASWSNFKTAMQNAHNKMRDTRKASWSTFESDMKICGLRDHGEKAHVVANPTYAY
jgi:hypothetical protein